MDTKRVLILTYYWPPSGGAGVQRWLKFVKYLPQYGVTPVVVTVDPKKASYPVTDTSLNDEVPDEVEVIRTNSFEPLTILGKLVGKKHVPHAGFSNVNTQSVLQRILRFIRGNFFVPDARVGWNGYAYRAAKKVLRQHSFDAVITTGPPHSTHLVGLKLKRKLGVRWIADFRDPWTDIYYYNQLMHMLFVKGHDARLERRVLMEADEVLTVGKTLKELLDAKKQENSVKILTNGFDPKDFEGFTRKKPEIFTITYMGTMAAQYNLQVFIEACQQLRNQEIPFRVRFVGQVAEAILKQFTQGEIAENLELIPYVEHKQALNYLAHSSALLLVMPDIPGNRGILTGKLFEYLATGLPIIGIGPEESDTAAVLNETNAGRMYTRDDQQELVHDLLGINEGITPTATKNNREKYSRETISKQLAALI